MTIMTFLKRVQLLVRRFKNSIEMVTHYLLIVTASIHMTLKSSRVRHTVTVHYLAAAHTLDPNHVMEALQSYVQETLSRTFDDVFDDGQLLRFYISRLT